MSATFESRLEQALAIHRGANGSAIAFMFFDDGTYGCTIDGDITEFGTDLSEALCSALEAKAKR